MTDKQIVETLVNVKEYCRKERYVFPNCRGCRFIKEEDFRLECGIKILFLELATEPDLWDMEEIERIINEVD